MSTFIRGLHKGIPICLGYIPIAITFGLLARRVGISLGSAVGISTFVYAGASQFIALNLIQLGVTAPMIILTVFLVNIRHMLMSASLSARISQPSKIELISFGVTDESFAVASMQPGELAPEFLLGLEVIPYLSWILGSWMGYVLGDFLPPSLATGLGISLYAMFIGLLVPAAAKSLPIATVAAVSGITHWILGVLGVGEVGLRMVAAIVVGAAVGAVLWTDKEDFGK